MSPLVRNIIGVVFIIVLVLSVIYLRDIFIYLAVAVVLSLLGRPVMHFLENIKVGKFHLPSSLNAMLTIALFYGVITILILAFAPLITDQIALIKDVDVPAVISSLDEPLERVDSFFARFQISNDGIPLKERITDYLTELADFSKLSGVFGSALGFVGNVFGLLISIFSITFIAFFFLSDKTLLYNSIFSIIPTRWEGQFDQVVNKSKVLMTRYIFGILVQVTVVTIYVTLAMVIVGVDNALLIGLFAGIVNIIPYVGPILGLTFGIFVGVTTNLDMDFYSQMMPLLIKIAIVFGSMQLLDNLFLQPLIFSNSVKAHPLEIFLLILIAGTMFGIFGMILAIPVYTILRVVAKEFLSEFKVVQTLTKNI